MNDEYSDHVLIINVLEHIYDTKNIISESFRVIKRGGLLISCTPFMHHIHGSPDDYHRFTSSAHRRILEDAGFVVEKIIPLGGGLASIFFQSVGGKIPVLLRGVIAKASIGSDRLLMKYFASYRRLCASIPMGYFVMARKP